MLITMSLGCNPGTNTTESEPDATLAADADGDTDVEVGADVDAQLDCPEDYASLEGDCRCIGQAEACLRDAGECEGSLDSTEFNCDPGALLWHVHYKRTSSGGQPLYATSPDGYLYVGVDGGEYFTDSTGRQIEVEGGEGEADHFTIMAFDPRGRFAWRARIRASSPSLESWMVHLSGTEMGVRFVMSGHWTDESAGDLVLTSEEAEFRVSGELDDRKRAVAEFRSDGRVARFDATTREEHNLRDWIGCHGFPPGEDGYTSFSVPATGVYDKNSSGFDLDGNCYVTATFLGGAEVGDQAVSSDISDVYNYEGMMVRLRANAEVDWIRRVYGDTDVTALGSEHIQGNPVASYFHPGPNRKVVVESTDGESSFAATPSANSVVKWDASGEMQWTKLLATRPASSRSAPRLTGMDADGERVLFSGWFDNHLAVYRRGAFYPVLLEREGINSFVALMDADGEFRWAEPIPYLGPSFVRLAGRSAIVVATLSDPVEIDGRSYDGPEWGELSDFIFVRYATD